VVDGTGLENRRGATHREFESRPLRHRKYSPYGLYFLCIGFGCYTYVFVGGATLPPTALPDVPVEVNELITNVTTA
jgi:hypothetical protein